MNFTLTKKLTLIILIKIIAILTIKYVYFSQPIDVQNDDLISEHITQPQ